VIWAEEQPATHQLLSKALLSLDGAFLSQEQDGQVIKGSQ